MTECNFEFNLLYGPQIWSSFVIASSDNHDVLELKWHPLLLHWAS